MLKSALILTTAMMLGACSSTPVSNEEGSATAARDDGYRCDKVKNTGSRMPVRRCTTTAQREYEKREAESLMRNRTVAPTSN